MTEEQRKAIEDAEHEALHKLIRPILNNLPISGKNYSYALASITTAFDMTQAARNQSNNVPVAELIFDPMFYPARKVPLVDWKIDLMDYDVGTKFYTHANNTKIVEELEKEIARLDFVNKTLLSNINDAKSNTSPQQSNALEEEQTARQSNQRSEPVAYLGKHKNGLEPETLYLAYQYHEYGRFDEAIGWTFQPIYTYPPPTSDVLEKVIKIIESRANGDNNVYAPTCVEEIRNLIPQSESDGK